VGKFGFACFISNKKHVLGFVAKDDIYCTQYNPNVQPVNQLGARAHHFRARPIDKDASFGLNHWCNLNFPAFAQVV
jgi:hypothetical protein